MNIEGSWDIPENRQKVWDALFDPEKLAQVIPGCEKLEMVGKDEFKGVMRIGLSAVKGVFEGKFRFSDKKPLVSYRLTAEGNGRAGFIMTDTIVTFSDIDMGTRVSYKSEVRLSGLITSVGQTIITGVARIIATQFFNRFCQLIKDS